MSPIPAFELNNGTSVPGIGLGCWGGVTKGERYAAREWMLAALKAGYRHLDTAWAYGTEESVGWAIRESGVPRGEIWVTTKLPPHHTGIVAESLDQSLTALGLDYVDLYLVHWPQRYVYDNDDPDPKDADGNYRITESPSIPEVWAQMEEVYAAGKARAIGVSNYSIKTLEVLLPTAKVVPAMNQVELHPYVAQPELKAYCDAKGIRLTAYTPTGYGTVRCDPTITALASKYGVTSAQIILAWHLWRGNAAVPKSANAEHQKSNLIIPKLSVEDVEKVSALDRGQRLCNKGDAKGEVYGWTLEQLGW
ncbi:Aldo/keto reductase [Neolentinus lepideus HHB14362 ss-1]|uniref:Aldo/keto reductase n=1 Tax=Neolentinus lepideus HHB14362 ss-1 TaxID=1314782 RepID=A0A165Q2D8_9AGAM|nr:Aldo/keto reductase [Neolentinus lepideus HHB14362 ss-1]